MKELLFNNITDVEEIKAKLSEDYYFSLRILNMIDRPIFDSKTVFMLLEDMNITGAKIMDGFNFSHHIIGDYVENIMVHSPEMISYINQQSSKRHEIEKAITQGAIKAKQNNDYDKLLFESSKKLDDGMSL